MTVTSLHSEAVLRLGKKIVDELALDESVDTLGRWMAHYIAQLMLEAETAETDDHPAKMSRCAEAILNLWKHRYELPFPNRPFEDWKVILRALESLDPTDDAPRYFRSIRMAIDETEENAESGEWLKAVDGLDYSAKLLIQYCLVLAAQSALDKTREWVALAEAAGADDEIDLSILHVIAEESDLLESTEPDERARKRLEDRLSRLKGFQTLAKGLASQLRRQLKHEGSR